MLLNKKRIIIQPMREFARKLIINFTLLKLQISINYENWNLLNSNGNVNLDHCEQIIIYFILRSNICCYYKVNSYTSNLKNTTN